MNDSCIFSGFTEQRGQARWLATESDIPRSTFNWRLSSSSSSSKRTSAWDIYGYHHQEATEGIHGRGQSQETKSRKGAKENNAAATATATPTPTPDQLAKSTGNSTNGMKWCSIPVTTFINRLAALHLIRLFFGHFEKNSRPKKLKDLEKLKDFFQKLKFLPTPKFWNCG